MTKEEAIAISGADSAAYLKDFNTILNTYISLGYEMYFDFDDANMTSNEVSELNGFVAKIKSKYPYAVIKMLVLI